MRRLRVFLCGATILWLVFSLRKLKPVEEYSIDMTGGAALTRIRVSDNVCRKDYEAAGEMVCRRKCRERGHFSLPGMDKCRKWLSCKEIWQHVRNVTHKLGEGPIKVAHLASWQGHPVVLHTRKKGTDKQVFIRGLETQGTLQPDYNVVQVIGLCHNGSVTEYHKPGSLHDVLYSSEKNSTMLRMLNNTAQRLRLCIGYTEVLRYLHASPLGTMVMCGSLTLNDTLRQFLVKSDFNLVVNDLDFARPINKKKNKLTRCSEKQLFGDFVAPEQTWTRKGEFDYEQKKPYDEKVDIWKIPKVCEQIIAGVPDSDQLLAKLQPIHDQCRHTDPQNRLKAKDIVKEYYDVLRTLK